MEYGMNNWQMRWSCVLLTSIFVGGQALQQFLRTGGLEAHHLLADPALPAISNGWGMLVMLALSFHCSARLATMAQPVAVFCAALLGAFAFGLLLSLMFALGWHSGILLALALALLAAWWLPLYQSHYLLGYLAGFSLTIGHVMPWLPAVPLVIAALAARYGRSFFRRSEPKRIC